MNDLRLIFRYGKPYRRDLWAAAGLIFIECIFEMVIPVLTFSEAMSGEQKW